MEDVRQTGVKIRVGAFVLASLLVFLGLIYMLGARARLFEPKHTVSADFVQVGGLTEGATVRLAGVQIGRVRTVHLPGQPGGKVRVEMRVGRQFADRIRGDSVARIDTQGLLGDKIVEITVGSASQPTVPSGGVIAAREPTDIAQVITESTEVVRKVSVVMESLKSTAESLNQSKLVENFAASAATARRVTEQIEKGSGWAHAVVYEAPAALRKIDAVADTAQRVMARVESSDILGNVSKLSTTLGTTADKLNETKVLDNLAAASESARVVVADLAVTAQGARRTVDALEQSRAVENLAAAAVGARRVVDQVEKGPGWAHALLYEEPQALKRLESVLASTQSLIDRAAGGEGALGVLTSAESGDAARRLVRAIERVARATDPEPGDEQGLVQALLYDARYRGVADDVKVFAHNLREVSDRLVGGRGTLGSLVKDEPGQPGLAQITADLRAAMANLRQVTEKINAGEGTLGALIADPTIYENLSAILGGVQRSRLLRWLLRGLETRGREPAEPAATTGPSPR
jgi:phospholipid/cholesterol/gamma-HCH transport system substrate-binding protein